MAVNPVDILLSLAKVAKAIYDQVQLAKANQAQCQTLSERVSIVMESVNGLGCLKDSGQYQKGLSDLETCLTECLSFIKTFGDEQSWLGVDRVFV